MPVDFNAVYRAFRNDSMQFSVYPAILTGLIHVPEAVAGTWEERGWPD